MDRIKQLKSIIAYYQEKEDIAARNLAQIQQQHKQINDNLQQLATYQQHYQQQLSTVTQIYANDLRNRSGFLSGLRQTMNDQQQAVLDIEQQVAHMRMLWQKAHTRVQSITLLIDKIKQRQQQKLEKREQKEIDEWVVHQFRSKNQK